MQVVRVWGRFILFLVINVFTLSKGEIRKQQLLAGDINIAGIFEVQTVGSSGECGAVSVSSVMAMEAVRWYLQSLNANSNDLKIGFSVYKTCGNLGLAGDAAVDIISTYRNSHAANSTEDFTVGVIGPEYSSETEVVSSVLGSQTLEDRLLQIGFSSTSTQLNDREKYPNYYRVAVEDRVQITAMLQLMLDLKWNRIAVIYVNDTYGRVGANMLQHYADGYHICISKINAIGIDSSRQVEATKIREILTSFVIEAPSIEGVVYFGNEAIANQVMQIFDSLRMTDVPIFILSESNLESSVFESSSGSLLLKTKGTLVLSMHYLEVSEFKQYWESLMSNKTALETAAEANPYLKDVFQYYAGCNVVTPSCAALSNAEIREKSLQSVYVRYAIFAAHTLIEAIRKFNGTKCNGKCNSREKFQSYFQPNYLIDAMDGLSVTYGGIHASFTKDTPNIQLAEGETEYEVYNFRKEENSDKFTFVNVGSLSDGMLTLDKGKIKDYNSDGSERSYPDIRRGQCPVDEKCSECISSDISEISYHIPGDFYVIGIVSINNKAIPGPLGCGTVRTRHGYQMYLSLEFSLKEFQTRSWYSQYKAMFAGKSIGLIVINSCNNALEVVPKILELHAKGLKLPDGSFLDLTNRILGYVGGQATDVSEPAAAQLTKLSFVQISYTSTNPILSDKHLYPYFLRIISPDNVQAAAMIDVVKELGGEYIQLVYSEGAYGEGGRDSVRAVAVANKICIIQEIMVRESDTYFAYYEIMRRKPHAKIVIIFLRSHVVAPFIHDIDKNMNRGEFQFIGSEAWGKNMAVLQYDITKGSIITAVEMDKNRDLEDYIKKVKPTYNVSDPWLENYIQNRQDCYCSWTYDKTFTKECTDDILPMNDPNFESDPWCIFVSNTMFAFLKGAAMFFSSKCGSSTSPTLCTDFVDNPKEFFNVLRLVEMDIYGTGDILIFDDKGDGLMGYKVYNIQEGQTDKTKRVYTPVGSYSPNSGLQLDKQNIRYPKDDPITSTCPSEGACSSCLGSDTDNTTIIIRDAEKSAAVPVLGALVGVLALVIIILVVLLVLFWMRKRKKPADTYLTPTFSARDEQRVIEEYRNEQNGYIDPKI
ncbi:uncharacterized protein LOC123561530 isoform X2 [Mercenaria mercenaria]|uniref:uncharacterized protein LOC123561530 isoform X2 n=1 Tax=Mercenaria mercenaria TaxID=6596 RepID=UPI00234EDE4C|nr:uncharacterized protein LOC123561530 isoform X2 [Mercenaria mercenaria]